MGININSGRDTNTRDVIQGESSNSEVEKPKLWAKWQFWLVVFASILLAAGVITWDQLIQLVTSIL